MRHLRFTHLLYIAQKQHVLQLQSEINMSVKYEKNGEFKLPQTPEQEAILVANGWVKIEEKPKKKGE